MTLNSEVSFDPEMLYFEKSRLSVASDKSFDPEGAAAHSEKSFDPDREDAASATSFDPDRVETQSQSSGHSFDPEREEAQSRSSEVSFDPDRTEADEPLSSPTPIRPSPSTHQPHQPRPYAPSFASERTFDASEYGGVRIEGSRVFDMPSFTDRSIGFSVDGESDADSVSDNDYSPHVSSGAIHKECGDAQQPLQTLFKELSTFNFGSAEEEDEESGNADLKNARGLVEGHENGAAVTHDEGRLASVLQELDFAKQSITKLKQANAPPETVARVTAALEQLKGFRTAIESALTLDQPAARQGGIDSSSERQAGLGFKFRRLRSGFFEVRELREGGPAQKSQALKVGDRIASIDGNQCKDLKTEQFANLVLGVPGSECRIEIQRPGQSQGKSLLLNREVKQPRGSPAQGGKVPEKRAEQRKGLGFTCYTNRTGEWFVHRLKAGGFAETSRQIFAGDKLISIDGSNCMGVSADEIKNILRVGARACQVKLMRDGREVTVNVPEL